MGGDESIFEEVEMVCQNCESPEDQVRRGMVSLGAMLAAVGMVACASRRRHRRHRGEGGGRRHRAEHDQHEHHDDHDHDHDHDHGSDSLARRRGTARFARRHGGGDHGPITRGVDPLRILEWRFASGKIDEEEFRRRRHALEDQSE